MDYNLEVGNRIRQTRKRNNMTMKELGNAVNLSEGNIQRYEAGKIKSLDVITMKQIAKALNVTPEYLLDLKTKSISCSAVNYTNFFGKNIRYLRHKNNISQEELSEMLGYKSFTTIQKWESEVTEPTLSTLISLSRIFKISIDILVNMDLQSISNKRLFPDYFKSPQEAVDFLINQNVIIEFNGLNITKLSEDEQLKYTDEVLNQIKLVSYKYKTLYIK